jgi:hypothetical protein
MREPKARSPKREALCAKPEAHHRFDFYQANILISQKGSVILRSILNNPTY